MLGFIKLFNKPSISEPVKPGKWYRIPLPQCVCGGRTPVHACIRTGTENKLMVVLYGGGVSWDAYMAARPTSIYGDPDPEANFYSVDTYLFSDMVLGHGLLSQKEDNAFRNWNVVAVPYATGDFHCGTGDFPYRDLKGKDQILPHHGYTNVMASIDAALKYMNPNPDEVMVTGFSAGGFGSAIIADAIFRRFPQAQSYICYNDSGFMLYPGWHEVAETVWKAPREIVERIVSDNISLDCMKALHKDWGEKVRILFSCSVRDCMLCEFWHYIDTGKTGADREDGISFQRDLKEMVKQLIKAVPDAAVILFDTPEKGKKEENLTVHCIGLSKAAERVTADGKTCMQWITDAVDGSGEKLGLGLLEEK